MLQEKYLPSFHFSERHSIRIAATPERIYQLITELNASESWIIKSLLTLRGISRKTTSGIEGWKKMGFVLLEAQPSREIMLGLIGQFWKAGGNVQSVTSDEFISFNDPRFAKATWNFEIKPSNENQVVLETETRILCMDENAKRKFGRYWFFIQPFSGLIRMEMLRIIKRNAER